MTTETNAALSDISAIVSRAAAWAEKLLDGFTTDAEESADIGQLLLILAKCSADTELVGAILPGQRFEWDWNCFPSEHNLIEVICVEIIANSFDNCLIRTYEINPILGAIDWHTERNFRNACIRLAEDGSRDYDSVRIKPGSR